MKALIYRNTSCQVPRWESVHEQQPRGYAYETDDRFVHIFGRDGRLCNISNGLSVTAPKEGTLRNWVEQTFGAQDIEESSLDVGETVEGIWRPGLYHDDEMLQGLGETDVSRRLAEQALLLLIQNWMRYFFS